jgi:hypothetical protein
MISRSGIMLDRSSYSLVFVRKSSSKLDHFSILSTDNFPIISASLVR